MPPKPAKGKGGAKAAAPLPPKPPTLSEEQWALANDLPRLLALLASYDKLAAKQGGSGKAAPPPPATKAQLALWVWQRAAAEPEAALRAGCIEVGLLCAHAW